MNCKPGDLAIVVSGFPQNIGGMVRVIRADSDPADQRPWWEVEALSSLVFAKASNPFRIVGRHKPGALVFVADADLRPIRGQPGADETLTWAGKPATKPEAIEA